MNYENPILTCLNYIEKNIKEELTLQSISSKVGYSEYHFLRVFKKQMGMTPMEYVKERKLICASKETLEIFSPIAAKLNMSKIKTELYDLSLKYLEGSEG